VLFQCDQINKIDLFALDCYETRQYLCDDEQSEIVDRILFNPLLGFNAIGIVVVVVVVFFFLK
jgi:hypothetical protein